MKEQMERTFCDGCGSDISDIQHPLVVTGGTTYHPRKGQGYVYTTQPRHYCVGCGEVMANALGISQ